MTERLSELSTILAALRYYQRQGLGEPHNRPDDIHELATCGDECVSLDDHGIDRLCEALNCGGYLMPETVEAMQRLLAGVNGNSEPDAMAAALDKLRVLIDSEGEEADDALPYYVGKAIAGAKPGEPATEDIGRYATLAEAEAVIEAYAITDPQGVAAGLYGIDGPGDD